MIIGIHGEMKISNSYEKMSVVVKPTPWENGKRWVFVKLHHSNSFFPSFEDLHRIIQALAFCEDEKYPDGKGRELLAEFLKESVFEKDYSKIAEKYKIPVRRGTEIIKTNGAKIINRIFSCFNK